MKFLKRVKSLEPRGLNKEFLLIAVILLVAAFLRFHDLSGYMTFLGDEGRDAIIVKRILTEYDFPLLGPVMSIGNMYLGPLYYYMMAIAMGIFWLNPVAAAGMNALIGVFTVGLVYYLTREWFGKYPALVGSLGYALSPVTIIYSRSSWNPNPVPFFSLLGIIGLYKAHKTKNFLWLILTGIALAFAIQMHYLSLILIPTFIIFWVYELIKTPKDKFKYFWIGSLAAIFVFLFLMSPLLIFDLKYNFMNYHAITNFFLNSKSSNGVNPLLIVDRVYAIFVEKLVGRYLVGDNRILGLILSLVVLIPIIRTAIFLINKKKIDWGISFISIWFLVGILLLSMLNQDIYDHYLNSINPIPYFLIAALISLFKNRLRFIMIIFFVIFFLIIGYIKNPLNIQPNNQLYRTQEIAKYVIAKSNEKPFNFALLAARNYDSAYQYYLDVYGHKPKAVPVDITDQLFVVCEGEICNPINNPKYEIAGFGYAKIVEKNEVMGLKVFKLVSNPGGRPQ